MCVGRKWNRATARGVARPDYRQIDMTDGFADMTDLQLRELYDLAELYEREAHKCKGAQAYTAGCVMLGAALEANLMAMVTLQAGKVAACKKLPRAKKGVKKLLEWNLDELLDVANELGWLPTDKTLGPDPKNWPIGTHAQVIRTLRNLIHPGRWLRDFRGFQFRPDVLTASFNVLNGVFLYLHAALAAQFEAPRDGIPSGAR